MFRGASAITLDSKSRITIPTRHREALVSDCKGKMVCTLDTQLPCLLLYPLPEWEEIELKLSQLSSTDQSERFFIQLVLGNAADCEMDRNGRLLINNGLKQHARLEKNVKLIGQFNKFEIWDEATWQAHMNQGINQLQSGELKLTERLLDLSL